MMRKLSRRPNLSPGIPANRDPRTVPQRAEETVIPSANGDKRKVSVRAWVVPEMTAVSNPKRRPPRAATIVLLRRYEFNFISLCFLYVLNVSTLWQGRRLVNCDRLPAGNSLRDKAKKPLIWL